MFKLVDVIHSHEHKTRVCSGVPDAVGATTHPTPSRIIRSPRNASVAVVSTAVFTAEAGDLKTSEGDAAVVPAERFVQTGGMKLKFTVMCIMHAAAL